MKYTDNTKGVLKSIRRIAKERAIQAAKVVQQHAIAEMKKPKSGQVYRIHGTDRTYVASAPGEFPAVRTGKLVESIRVSSMVGPVGISGIISVVVAHGAILEAGLRPWLNRLVIETEQEVKDIFTAPWRL